MDIQKNSIAIRISREMALDYGMVEPTPEEAAEREASRKRFAAEQAASRRDYLAAIEKLNASQNPIAAALMELHAPDLRARYFIECPGCDFGGYEGEPPEWPCRTIRTIADHIGVTLPNGDLPGAEYDQPKGDQ